MITFGFISQIALIFSGVGIIVFVFKKIPVLLNLQTPVSPKKLRANAYLKLKNVLAQRIKYEMFLQKVLTQFRILTLKTDSKTFNWLKRLREKAKEKKFANTNYWKELRKTKSGK